jgi:outer membrane protein OmpA-like peptidoglycan-associated protein
VVTYCAVVVLLTAKRVFMNNPMKKGCVLLLVMLLSVAGCGRKKKATDKTITAEKGAAVSLPVGQDSKELVFDDDIAEFALVDDTVQPGKPAGTTVAKADVKSAEEDAADEFSWIDDEERQNIKTVYFDFDKYAIRQDQEESVVADVKAVKTALSVAEKDGKRARAIVEGHACHSAGSAAYNLALSEKRAKVLQDRLVQSGIPGNSIKVVGRGQECPAVGKDGKPVTGTREQQWPNRRDEINIINA